MSPLPKPRFRFGASNKLKHRRDFIRLKAKGNRIVLGCLVANWQPLSDSEKCRLGVVTSGRIGSAVVRSRARRLMRESFRLHAREFAQPLDLVLVARPSIVGKSFNTVERDLLAILKKAGLLATNTEAQAKQ